MTAINNTKYLSLTGNEEMVSAYMVPRIDVSASKMAEDFEVSREIVFETLKDLEAKGFVVQNSYSRWNQTNLGFRFYQTFLADRNRRKNGV